MPVSEVAGRTPGTSAGKMPPPRGAKRYWQRERLRELGHELRRPEADTLWDGIYELRASVQGVHYSVLYFFQTNPAKHSYEESAK